MKTFVKASILAKFLFFAHLVNFFEVGHAGPAIPVIIGSLIPIGGAVTCNLIGCYGYRKLQHFDASSSLNACKNHDYHINLVVDGHLKMLLLPESINGTTAPGCQSYIVHAKYNSETDLMEKEVLEFDSDSSSSIFDALSTTRNTLVPFGSYPLKKAARAFRKADVNSNGLDNEKYDIITNNCGDFLASFLKNIGHKTSTAEMTAIASNLILASPEVVTKMRVAVTGTRAEHLSDLDLVLMVVQREMASMIWN